MENKKVSILVMSLALISTTLIGCRISTAPKNPESSSSDIFSSNAPISSLEEGLSEGVMIYTISQEQFDGLFGLNGKGYFYNENTNVTISATNVVGIDQQVETIVGLDFRFNWISGDYDGGDEMHIFNQEASSYPTSNVFDVYRKASGTTTFNYAGPSTYTMPRLLKEAGLITPTSFEQFSYDETKQCYHADEITLESTTYYDLEYSFQNGKLVKSSYKTSRASSKITEFTFTKYGESILPMDSIVEE